MGKKRRAICYLLGLIILALGISLTIISQLGIGAWDALSVGLASITGLTVGTWVVLIGIILVFINAVILVQKPDFLSMFTVFLLGYFIDFWLLIVLPNVIIESQLFRFLVLIGGIVIIALGIATYLQAKFAVIPIDAFMFAIKNRLGLTLRTAKTVTELFALIFAYTIGGPIGIGTLIVTFSIGPLIQKFIPFVGHIAKA